MTHYQDSGSAAKAQESERPTQPQFASWRLNDLYRIGLLRRSQLNRKYWFGDVAITLSMCEGKCVSNLELTTGATPFTLERAAVRGNQSEPTDAETKEALAEVARWNGKALHTAEHLAKRYGITRAERERLGLRTIGAIDETAKERRTRKAKER